VSELKEKGWTFAYIGTNQDVDAIADDMGIHSRMSYDYSPEGVREMFEKEQLCKKVFYSKLSREGKNFMMERDYDYFCQDEKDNSKDSL
jgi:hypothetical protein